MISQGVKNLYWATVGRASLLNLYWRKLLGRLKTPASPVRLNLGCGPRYVQGYVNVEGNLFLKKDLWLDISHGLPYRDGQVEVAYMSHVLEHFAFPEAVSLIREVHRVLAPGGGLRVVVPSLEKAVEAWARGDGEWFPSWPDDFRSVGGRFNNYILCRDQHRLLLDRSFLFEILERGGFAEPQALEWGRSLFLDSGDLERLEPLDSRGFFEDSLIVEALKR